MERERDIGARKLDNRRSTMLRVLYERRKAVVVYYISVLNTSRQHFSSFSRGWHGIYHLKIKNITQSHSFR
jgi:hypothetical protein